MSTSEAVDMTRDFERVMLQLITPLRRRERFNGGGYVTNYQVTFHLLRVVVFAGSELYDGYHMSLEGLLEG